MYPPSHPYQGSIGSLASFVILMSYKMMIGFWADPNSFTTFNVTASSSDRCMNMNEVRMRYNVALLLYWKDLSILFSYTHSSIFINILTNNDMI